MNNIEQEDLNMTQARDELAQLIAWWGRERSLAATDAIFLLKDGLNVLEWQNREDAEFDEGDEWMLMQ